MRANQVQFLFLPHRFEQLSPCSSIVLRLWVLRTLGIMIVLQPLSPVGSVPLPLVTETDTRSLFPTSHVTGLMSWYLGHSLLLQWGLDDYLMCAQVMEQYSKGVVMAGMHLCETLFCPSCIMHGFLAVTKTILTRGVHPVRDYTASQNLCIGVSN